MVALPEAVAAAGARVTVDPRTSTSCWSYWYTTTGGQGVNTWHPHKTGLSTLNVQRGGKDDVPPYQLRPLT